MGTPMDRISTLNKQVKGETSAKSPDSLTITDNRTGKSYTIAITHNTIKASDLKKIKNADGEILRSFDPGFTNTASCISKISFIDGDKGILRYRGYPIEELSNCSFEEVAFLLFWGELPTEDQLATFKSELMSRSYVHDDIVNIIKGFRHDAHPMSMLSAVLSAMGSIYPEDNPSIVGQDVYKNVARRNDNMVRLLAKMPVIAALIHRHRCGLPVCQPDERMSWTENFLNMITNPLPGIARTKPHPKLVNALEVLFVLHAEHELNCSTAATRHLASSAVDVYSTISAAIGALYGPRHGGANEAVVHMLERIGSVDKIDAFIAGVKNKTERLMGFGHRVYKNYDPRARMVRKVAEDVFTVMGKQPLIEVAMELEKRALNDPYFVERKLYPNVDFYSGLIYKAMGIPTDFYPVLFAVPRTAGWLAHWNEFLDDPDNKIARPFQIYLGHDFRKVPATKAERQKSAQNTDKNALVLLKSTGVAKQL
eukprot:GDKJ01002608.1.p1 GENE.GDKJ01002608.1~~GDKJ01002608.1.p1  ORF type:complete len:482 (-),score=102.35 GDKJ01002608.1:448-1893(-)